MDLNPAPVYKDQWILVRNARQLLTLQGPSGPRRGLVMSELSIVRNGALLIRNGVVEDIGSARRIENLSGARKAREVDATGKIVMPAFVDADVGLVSPAPVRTSPEGDFRDDPLALRLMSRKRVVSRAAAMAAECSRYGTLSVGAHTRYALDLQNTGKALRAHQVLQTKPLRIRSIFSPQWTPASDKSPAQLLEALVTKWLPSVKSRKLASVVELSFPDKPADQPVDRSGGSVEAASDTARLRTAAIAAASLGFAIRFRSTSRLDPADLQLALLAGAIAIVAPVDTLRAFAGPLSAVGCVRVIPASEAFDDAEVAAEAIRYTIDAGAAIALTSSYRSHGPSTLNMQYLLHLAVARLGLTDEEAIVATTWNAACSLRLSHATGSLEPGKAADLIVMDVPDYRDLARRAGHHDAAVVMRAGQVLT